MARQPPVGQSLLIIEVSRSHLDTAHSVGLLWPSDRPVAETSTDIDARGGIRTRIPSKRKAANPRLRPQSHRNQPNWECYLEACLN